MNKQNAIIFAACVLVATAASVGVKNNEKKQKEQIKQELNNILIPNAERKLDSLIITRNLLHDSIVYFQNELQNQSQYIQIKKQIPEIKSVLTLLENITNQWHRQYSQTADRIAAYPDSVLVPTELQQRQTYLKSNIVTEPVMNNKEFDFIAEHLINTLDSHISCFEKHNPQDVQQEYKIINNFYETIHCAKDFVFAIDKSQNIINKRDLKRLEQQTDLLLKEFAKILFAQNGEITVDKLYQLRQNNADNEYALKKHMKELAKLKTSYAVDEIYRQRKK